MTMPPPDKIRIVFGLLAAYAGWTLWRCRTGEQEPRPIGPPRRIATLIVVLLAGLAALEWVFSGGDPDWLEYRTIALYVVAVVIGFDVVEAWLCRQIRQRSEVRGGPVGGEDRAPSAVPGRQAGSDSGSRDLPPERR